MMPSCSLAILRGCSRMNKPFKSAVNQTLAVGSYESPTVSVVEVISEGVLCGSGDFYEEWDEEDNRGIWS